MSDFPVNPRHAALIAAADDYAMDQIELRKQWLEELIAGRCPAFKQFLDELAELAGLTLACDIIGDDNTMLLWKGYVLTAEDVLWLVDLGFDYSYIKGVTTTPVVL